MHKCYDKPTFLNTSLGSSTSKSSEATATGVVLAVKCIGPSSFLGFFYKVETKIESMLLEIHRKLFFYKNLISSRQDKMCWIKVTEYFSLNLKI